jgi:hypothetical protein
MNIQSMIKPAWKSVQSAHFEGFLQNHDMFVFAFCKAIPERIPTVYDGRQIPNATFKPNFFMLSEDETPSLTFIGKLRYAPAGSEVIEQDLFELNRYFSNLAIDVLTDGNKRTETRMTLSPDAHFGYFLLTEETCQTVEKIVQHSLTEDDCKRFHFAFGSRPIEKGQVPEFRYQPPQSATI